MSEAPLTKACGVVNSALLRPKTELDKTAKGVVTRRQSSMKDYGRISGCSTYVVERRK